MALEGTNNLIFGCAHSIPIQDQKVAFDDKTRIAMGWPDSIKTMHDYRARNPAIYNRLFQLCIVSHCADIEFFFKSLFESQSIPHPKDRGFFQHFDRVISALAEHCANLNVLSAELALLKHAFHIRHMCIHNFGFVDASFAAKSSTSIEIGELYLIDQEEYRPMFDGYVKLLLHIDGWLSAT